MGDRRITIRRNPITPDMPRDDLGNIVPPEYAGDVYPEGSKVYVDQLQKYDWAALHPNARRIGVRSWCHLFGRNRDTLVELALVIGLKLRWEQPARDIQGMTIYHFDLTPAMRRKAIIAGAIEVQTAAGTIREWIKTKDER